MIFDTNKPIKITKQIKKTIKNCIDLIEQNPNHNLYDSVSYKSLKEKFQNELENDYISLEFLKKIKKFWNQNSAELKIYLNDLLKSNELYLPKYEAPERDPEFDLKMNQIKAQIEEENYQKMVKNVNLSASRFQLESTNKSKGLFAEFKTVQGQVIAIFNIVAVIIGAFMFGYKAVEYSLDAPDIAKQMMGGLLLGIIVAIADFYFLFKKLMKLDKEKS